MLFRSLSHQVQIRRNLQSLELAKVAELGELIALASRVVLPGHTPPGMRSWEYREALRRYHESWNSTSADLKGPSEIAASSLELAKDNIASHFTLRLEAFEHAYHAQPTAGMRELVQHADRQLQELLQVFQALPAMIIAQKGLPGNRISGTQINHIWWAVFYPTYRQLLGLSETFSAAPQPPAVAPGASSLTAAMRPPVPPNPPLRPTSFATGPAANRFGPRVSPFGAGQIGRAHV